MQISFASEQMEKQVYGLFAVDGSLVKPELLAPFALDKPPAKPDSASTSTSATTDGDLGNQQLLFWNAFVE